MTRLISVIAAAFCLIGISSAWMENAMFLVQNGGFDLEDILKQVKQTLEEPGFDLASLKERFEDVSGEKIPEIRKEVFLQKLVEFEKAVNDKLGNTNLEKIDVEKLLALKEAVKENSVKENSDDAARYRRGAVPPGVVTPAGFVMPPDFNATVYVEQFDDCVSGCSLADSQQNCESLCIATGITNCNKTCVDTNGSKDVTLCEQWCGYLADVSTTTTSTTTTSTTTTSTTTTSNTNTPTTTTPTTTNPSATTTDGHNFYGIELIVLFFLIYELVSHSNVDSGTGNLAVDLGLLVLATFFIRKIIN